MCVTKICHLARTKHIALVFVLFCVVYYMNVQLDLTRSGQVPSDEDIGPECAIPQLEHFPYQPTKCNKHNVHKMPNIKCGDKDWVKCYQSTCKVVDDVLDIMEDITCTYTDILYLSDGEYQFGDPVDIRGDGVYTLVDSDHIKVNCSAKQVYGLEMNWTHDCTGFRKSVERINVHDSENMLHVLILMFDSTSRSDFIRNLPKTYEYLVTALNGVVLNAYNIVGDGTPGALFPILTGHADHELPNVRRDSHNNRTMDSFPFIFYKLKEIGYRTAYLEDMPWIGTFQYKYNGFEHQPADHYLRHFFIDEVKETQRIWRKGTDRFCVGGTPQFQLMLELTNQFLALDGRRFSLTLIADLAHDDVNMLSVADVPVMDFFQMLKNYNHFKNTLVFVMSDHGPRFGKIRNTLRGRLEERLPFVCVILPDELKRRRPDAQAILKVNANRWTTPFDVHTTILDALDMPQSMNTYKVPGANIPRGMSFLKPIPENRSCWDAGIEPHWCTCLLWRTVSTDDPFYEKAAINLMRYINLLTDPLRNKCAARSIISIDWVKRLRVNKKMMTLKKGGMVEIVKDDYQVRLVMSPGKAIFEASMTYVYKTKRFLLESRHISRIDSYGEESRCVIIERPNLSMYCYCVNNEQE